MKELLDSLKKTGRKMANEVGDFYDEIFVENAPRYRDPKQWASLYVDVFVGFFSMSYTLGHLAAVYVAYQVLIGIVEVLVP